VTDGSIPDGTAPDQPFVRDRGLAGERTELAWGRSGMALFACGAAVAKGIPKVTGEGRPIIGIIILILGGITWLVSIPLERARRSTDERARLAVHTHELIPVAVGTAAVGLAAFVLAAFFPN
jgi:uncharacterized membrane protein YidH (DUF202 family)